MVTFLKKIISLASIVILLIVGLLFIENNYIERNANFKLEDKVKYVVFGHSHSECAFNDSLISSFNNLSEPGEAYFYTYQKLKNVILQNPEIEAVFVEFTNNQVLLSMDNKVWEDKYLTKNMHKYAPFLEFNDYVSIIKNNAIGLSNSLSITLKKNTPKIIKNDLNYFNKIGGYHSLKRNKTDSLLKNYTINKLKYQSYNEVTYSESYAYKYLKKIVVFCKQQNKKMYFVRSPQHQKNKTLINETDLLKIKDSFFKEVTFLDFNQFPVENSGFGDLSHLNHNGSDKFSRWFDAQLKNEFKDYWKKYSQPLR